MSFFSDFNKLNFTLFSHFFLFIYFFLSLLLSSSLMFQYTEPLYSASNDPLKLPSFTTATTRPGQHYPYDPEFYHNSTAVSWQPPNYSEVQPTVDYPGSSHSLAPSRPRITTSLWDDEGTVCYQVDVRGICVARRQGNNNSNNNNNHIHTLTSLSLSLSFFR